MFLVDFQRKHEQTPFFSFTGRRWKKAEQFIFKNPRHYKNKPSGHLNPLQRSLSCTPINFLFQTAFTTDNIIRVAAFISLPLLTFLQFSNRLLGNP